MHISSRHPAVRGSSRLLTAVALVASMIASMNPDASAQITMDPDGSIGGEVSGEGAAEVFTMIDHTAMYLGVFTEVTQQSNGPAQDYEGSCPPLGTILDDQVHPLSATLGVSADGPGGENLVELEIDYCTIVGENPCQVQCFTITFLWENRPHGDIFTAFIAAPPQTGSPPLVGWTAQFIENAEGCHVIQIVVTPWGQVMTGEQFATQYPDHVGGFLASLEGRLFPMAFDAECVTFSKP